VLRFYLLWDIPAEQGGGRARFKMHYFVADSTVSRLAGQGNVVVWPAMPACLGLTFSHVC